MRYLAILALVVGIWYFVGRSKTGSSSSVTPQAAATPRAAASPARTNAIKAPIDRAGDVVKTVNRKTAEGF